MWLWPAFLVRGQSQRTGLLFWSCVHIFSLSIYNTRNLEMANHKASPVPVGRELNVIWEILFPNSNSSFFCDNIISNIKLGAWLLRGRLYFPYSLCATYSHMTELKPMGCEKWHCGICWQRKMHVIFICFFFFFCFWMTGMWMWQWAPSDYADKSSKALGNAEQQELGCWTWWSRVTTLGSGLLTFRLLWDRNDSLPPTYKPNLFEITVTDSMPYLNQVLPILFRIFFNL